MTEKQKLRIQMSPLTSDGQHGGWYLEIETIDFRPVATIEVEPEDLSRLLAAQTLKVKGRIHSREGGE